MITNLWTRHRWWTKHCERAIQSTTYWVGVESNLYYIISKSTSFKMLVFLYKVANYFEGINATTIEDKTKSHRTADPILLRRISRSISTYIASLALLEITASFTHQLTLTRMKSWILSNSPVHHTQFIYQHMFDGKLAESHQSSTFRELNFNKHTLKGTKHTKYFTKPFQAIQVDAQLRKCKFKVV